MRIGRLTDLFVVMNVSNCAKGLSANVLRYRSYSLSYIRSSAVPVMFMHGGDGSGQRGTARNFSITPKGQHTGRLCGNATKDSKCGITGDDGEDCEALSAWIVVKLKLGL